MFNNQLSKFLPPPPPPVGVLRGERVLLLGGRPEAEGGVRPPPRRRRRRRGQGHQGQAPLLVGALQVLVLQVGEGGWGMNRIFGYFAQIVILGERIKRVFL